METCKVQDEAAGILQSAETAFSPQQPLAFGRSLEKEFPGATDQNMEDDTRQARQTAAEWVREAALEQALFQEQDEAAPQPEERRYRHHGRPCGPLSAHPADTPSVPLHDCARSEASGSLRETTQGFGGEEYEDRPTRPLSRSLTERAWKRRPAGTREDYARAGLSAAEAQWIASINEMDILKDEKVALETVLQCPLSFVGSSDFVVLSGILLGRLLAMDEQGRRDVRADLKRLYSYIGGWSFFDPEACGFLLAIVDPEVIYACILFWPEKYRRERAFFVSVLLGLYAEKARGTEFLRNGGVDLLLDLMEGERRPDTLLSAI